MARAVQSTSVQSNNVLLKVTVPKRTGRKRKRGSNEPFTDETKSDANEPPPRRTAKDLLRSLSDNASNYQIEIVGRVERTHVFRGTFATLFLIYCHLLNVYYQESRISCSRLQRVPSRIDSETKLYHLTVRSPGIEFGKYPINRPTVEKIKKFDIDMGKGAALNADLIPPPSFSHGDVPFHYL